MIWILLLVIAAAAMLWVFRDRIRRRPVPGQLAPGAELPEFEAEDEDGNVVCSADLRGSPAVLLFVRASWCPFCARQVQDLTRYYKEINDTGARLILVTPKPLATTRRVADIFGVNFEFWLDRSLSAAAKLGLLLSDGVPASERGEYGSDTMWPTALIVDRDGIIRYTELSRFIADRPDPAKLLEQLRKL